MPRWAAIEGSMCHVKRIYVIMFVRDIGFI